MTRKYNFSGYFWEKQEYNGVVTLVNRMRMGKQTCEKLKAGYELRVSSEENHATTLLQMASNLQTCEESGQLGQLLTITQEQWILLANAHLQTAKDLNSNVILPLSNLLIKQKQLRRELQANVTKFYNNRQLQTHCVLRARDRYNAECTKANETMQQSSGKEKLLTYKRVNANIKKFKQAYDNSMEDLKMVTEEWNKQWQYTCQEFERLEEERMTFIQNNIYTCNSLLSKTLDSSAQVYEKIDRAIDMVDVDGDLDDFVQKNGGTDTIPDAMDYINIYVLQEATKPLDKDETQHDKATSSDSVSHTLATMDSDPYSNLEVNERSSLDTTDSNSNATSLMFGRMEMYNSDDDNLTDSDYDDDNGDGDYDDYEYGHDETLNDDTTEYQYSEPQYYLGENDRHQQDNRFNDHDDVTNDSFPRLHHSTRYYDNKHYQNNLIQHDDGDSRISLRNMDTDDGSGIKDTAGKSPLEGLGIEATHGKSSRANMDNDLELYDEEQADQTSTLLHQNFSDNSSEYLDKHSNTTHDAIDDDYSNTDESRETGMVDQRPTTEHLELNGMDAATKQKYRHPPPPINTQYQPAAVLRQQQRTPPPVPEHQCNPTPSMDLADDNVSMVSTPENSPTNSLNEELDDMLRQLEQQTIIQSHTVTPEPRSLTKKQPSSSRIKLSGVRPRAPKTKPGQKLLREMAGINTTTATNDNSNIGDNTLPPASTIFAGSDDTFSLSNSLASRKEFFDPFSSLASMSSKSLSIASTTSSTAQIKLQQQKQQKWKLDEVTRAMRQNTKQRPLPERPMNSTSDIK